MATRLVSGWGLCSVQITGPYIFLEADLDSVSLLVRGCLRLFVTSNKTETKTGFAVGIYRITFSGPYLSTSKKYQFRSRECVTGPHVYEVDFC